MRYKISLQNTSKHQGVVAGIGWTSPDELFSCAEDHKLLQWNLLTNETSTVVELTGIFPTDLQLLPKAAILRNKTAADAFIIASSDGKCHIVNKLGRIEKSFECHKGSCLSAKWSHDGTAILTGGEDGQVKTWSRSGMLRSTIVQIANPVYSASWAPDNDAVLYTSGQNLVIKKMTPNSKPTQWKAHDGIILTTDWNPNLGFIVSGGEDTRYKVWDGYGRQMYTSGPDQHPITALSWSPDGQLFAVGSFNTIRLCDKAGWCHSMEKPNTGSIFNLAWSSDSTQVGGACGNGQVLFAHIIKRQLEWKNYEATVATKSSITLKNLTNEANEKLEFRDRIIKASFSHSYLIVVTSTQAHVYSTKNWNTPVIFDLKESSVSLILQTQKHFLLVDGTSVLIYSYEGRLVSSPKLPFVRTDNLSDQIISLSNDTLAIKSREQEKAVYLYDAISGKALNDGKAWSHKIEIKALALDQTGPSKSRKMSILDRNADLFLVPIQRVGAMRAREVKLAGMIQSIRWCDDSNQLAALQDSILLVWCFPAVAFVDRDLLPLTVWKKDGSRKNFFETNFSNSEAVSASEFGKNAEISSFINSTISIRRADGCLLSCAVSPYPILLYNHVNENRWDDALQLARFAKDDLIWATLAGYAISNKKLETAEIAYAAIEKSDKVGYIQYIKDIPVKEAQEAEMSLLGGHISDAELILLQSGLHFRAIMLNLQTYQWERALQLALKYKTHVQTVTAYRTRYNARFAKTENNKLFLQHGNDVEIDWNKIQNAIDQEYEQENNHSKK